MRRVCVCPSVSHATHLRAPAPCAAPTIGGIAPTEARRDGMRTVRASGCGGVVPFLWCFPCCAPRCPPPAGRGQIASASCASAQMGARTRDADGRDSHLRARHARALPAGRAQVRTRRTSPLATARSPPLLSPPACRRAGALRVAVTRPGRGRRGEAMRRDVFRRVCGVELANSLVHNPLPKTTFSTEEYPFGNVPFGKP